MEHNFSTTLPTLRLCICLFFSICSFICLHSLVPHLPCVCALFRWYFPVRNFSHLAVYDDHRIWISKRIVDKLEWKYSCLKAVCLSFGVSITAVVYFPFFYLFFLFLIFVHLIHMFVCFFSLSLSVYIEFVYTIHDHSFEQNCWQI